MLPTRAAVELNRKGRRDVAQPGSALAWGARGPEFKSRRPDHSKRIPADSTVSAFVSAFGMKAVC